MALSFHVFLFLFLHLCGNYCVHEFNQVGDSGANAIAEALKENSSLQSLNFVSSSITFCFVL